MFSYKCHGTCSTSIDLEIQDGVITYCKINNGCRGNTAGLAKMVTGQKADATLRSSTAIVRSSTSGRRTLPATSSCPKALKW